MRTQAKALPMPSQKQKNFQINPHYYFTFEQHLSCLGKMAATLCPKIIFCGSKHIARDKSQSRLLWPS
jgi:hypothetical protein